MGDSKSCPTKRSRRVRGEGHCGRLATKWHAQISVHIRGENAIKLLKQHAIQKLERNS